MRFGSDELPDPRGRVLGVLRSPADHVSSLYDTPMPFAMFFSGGQAVHYSPDFAANGYSRRLARLRQRARLRRRRRGSSTRWPSAPRSSSTGPDRPRLRWAVGPGVGSALVTSSATPGHTGDPAAQPLVVRTVRARRRDGARPDRPPPPRRREHVAAQGRGAGRLGRRGADPHHRPDPLRRRRQVVDASRWHARSITRRRRASPAAAWSASAPSPTPTTPATRSSSSRPSSSVAVATCPGSRRSPRVTARPSVRKCRPSR